MKQQFAILSILIIAASANPLLTRQNGRIVGGLPIDIVDAPYQVSLQDRGFHICGGSIIGPNHVLTAAHCTYGASASSFTIRAGSSFYRNGGVTVQVEKIIQHEKFDYYNIDYDFSVLRLAESLNFTDSIKAVQLPEQDEEVEDGSLCFVSGWGTTHNSAQSREKLRAAFVPSVNQDDCAYAYSNFGPITNQMICAGFKKGQIDACQGEIDET